MGAQPFRPRRARAAAAVLAAAVALAACTGEPATAPAGSPQPAATPAASPPAPATATAAAPPSPSPSPGPATVAAGAIAELGIAVGRETRWGELFETLTAAERSCSGETFGAALDETLARPIGAGEAWEAAAFACLAPATARAVFLESLLAGMAADLVEPDAAELACLRTVVAGADVAALVAAASAGGPGAGEFTGAFFRCLPDIFLELMVGGAGLDPAGLSAEERACLLEAFGDADPAALGARDEVASALFAVDLFGCVPALYVSLVAGVELTPSAAEAACLRESFARLGRAVAGAADLDAGRAAELVRCVPDLLMLVMLREVGAGLDDVGEDELACMREWAAGVDAGEWFVAAAAGDDVAAATLGLRFFACAPALLVPGDGE